MSNDRADRPEPTRKNRGPVPSSDEGLDPVETTPAVAGNIARGAAASTATTEQPRRRQREATYQVGVNIGEQADERLTEIVDRLKRERGWTKRRVLEDMILTYKAR